MRYHFAKFKSQHSNYYSKIEEEDKQTQEKEKKEMYGYGFSYGRSRSYYSTGSQHNQRILRAFEQPLQLLRCRYFPNSTRWEIHISSSTGHGSYEISLTPTTGSCNCPDFERRQKPCKHMLCVLLRILKLKDHEFTTVKQVGKSYEEITQSFLKLFKYEERATEEEIVKKEEEDDQGKKKKGKKRKSTTTETQPTTDIITKTSTMTPENVTDAKSTASTEAAAPPTEEMCIICLLEFQSNDENVLKCSSHCARWLGHKDCLNSWFAKSILCPLCKGPQAQPKASNSESHYKRPRYAYYRDDDDEVDIEALQAQVQEEQNLPAFFEIIQE